MGWRLRAYLGFELFQKTVWRSAAARLQQRPRRGAQRSSIARGRAGRGRRAPRGLGSRWLSPGRSRRRAHRSDSGAPRLRLLGRRRPAPPPRPRPAPPRAALRPRGWGAGGRERRGEARRGGAGSPEPGARLCRTGRLRAACSLTCGSARGFVGLCVCVAGGLCSRIFQGARGSLGPAPFPSLAP